MKYLALILILSATAASQWTMTSGTAISPPPPQGVPWATILDPGRAMDWSHAGVHGGIPYYTIPCQTVLPTGNGTDTTAINAALTTCANTATGQVVQLVAGTYYLTAGITFNYSNTATVNNVVLRGAGPDKTKLMFTGLGPCNADVCIYGSLAWTNAYTGTTYTGGGAVWAGTSAVGVYNRGDTQIILGPPSVLPAGSTNKYPGNGNLIYLDQRNDEVGICPKLGQGAGVCANAGGASQSGNTVTINTALPHGYALGDCVGIAMVGAPAGAQNEINIPAAEIGYNSSQSPGDCVSGPNSLQGFFQVTAVDSPTSFKYSISPTGVAASGGGRTGKDTGGLLVSDIFKATMGEAAPPMGRVCPQVSTAAPNPSCVIPDENGMTLANYRSQLEIHQLTSDAIPSGTGACPAGLDAGYSCYTIDEPIIMPNWRSSQAPGAWWPGPLSSMNGIEDLSMDYAGDGGIKSTPGVKFQNVTDSWVKNIRAVNVNRNAVQLLNASHISVVDSYFAGSKGAASQSYMVESYAANQNLVQNNICQHSVNCLMIGQDMASVWAYNYGEDTAYNIADFLMTMFTKNHDYGQLSLFESNNTPAQSGDNVHGNGALQTGFRERIRGQDTPIKTNNLITVSTQSFNRGWNWIGDVLGTVPYHTAYQRMDLRLPLGIFGFGQQGMWAANDVRVDNLMIESTLRWGNYDVATGTTRWCGTGTESTADCSCGSATWCAVQREIPNQSSAFVSSNFVPANHNLPPSFYLSSKPAFWQTPWGTSPWPAIGSDVTGGDALDTVAGHSYNIPSQLCYKNTPVDPAYQRTFIVTGANWTGTSSSGATLTIDNASAGNQVIFPSDVVIVAGVNPNGFNGTYNIDSASTTSISYRNQPNTDPGLYQSGGTVTFPNFRLFNGRTCYPGDFQ